MYTVQSFKEQQTVESATLRETRLKPESSLGMSLSSRISMSPSMSEPSLELVLPSEPVDAVEDVESFPDTFGLASVVELL